MMRLDEIWDALIQKSTDFKVYLNTETDMDVKLKAFEVFLVERELLIEALSAYENKDLPEKQEQLYTLDHEIQETLKGWMAETKGQLEKLKLQREGIVKAKRTSSAYNKRTTSAEGYFIDKKK